MKRLFYAFFLACESATPPPKIAETPIDQPTASVSPAPVDAPDASATVVPEDTTPDLRVAWTDAVATKKSANVHALFASSVTVYYDDGFTMDPKIYKRGTECARWQKKMQTVTGADLDMLASCIASTVAHGNVVDTAHPVGTLKRDAASPLVPATVRAKLPDRPIVHWHTLGASDWDLTFAATSGKIDFLVLTVLRGE